MSINNGTLPDSNHRKRTKSSSDELFCMEVKETPDVTKDPALGHDDVTVDTSASHHVIYKVYDVPPVFMWPVYGMQQVLLCMAGNLTVPFFISSSICADQLPEVRAQLLSITFFMCGVATLLQNTIGIRLPILQGASFAFLPPIAAMMQLELWKCPDPSEDYGENDEPWKVRMREIQGNLIVASLTQVILGGTGMIGFMLRFIGPVTIAPTIALIGMGFTTTVTDFAEKQWGVAAFTAGMVLLFSLWLGKIRVPVPSYSKENGCHFTRFPVFVVVSVLLAVVLGWLLCLILTVSDALPTNSTLLAYKARTDINLDVVSSTPWFEFPYPLQFGIPTISVAGFFGMFMATIATILESMGDYYACASVSGAPPPPPHAINRGIAIEGFSSIISGLVGAGHATTSYSNNIAAIALTRVASRRAFQAAGVILIVLGVVTKVGAVMTLIPDPVIGGLNCVMLGSLIAVGVATLGYVDMNSPRNITIVGFAFMMGLAIPQWINAKPGRIDTGDEKADQVLNVLLGTPMFVGGLLGAILDNLAPGTPEERGIKQWQKTLSSHDNQPPTDQEKRSEQDSETALTYDLPYVSEFMRRIKCCTYIPFLPSFEGCCRNKSSFKSCGGCCGNKYEEKEKVDTNSDVAVVGYRNKSFETEIY